MIKPFPTIIVDFSAWLTEYANAVCTTVDVEGKDPRRRLLHTSIDHDRGNQQGRLRNCPISGGLPSPRGAHWGAQERRGRHALG